MAAVNHLLSVTDRESVATGYAYDHAGRPVSKTNSLCVTRWTFDHEGNVLTLTQPDASIKNYTYNEANWNIPVVGHGFQITSSGGMPRLH